MPIIKSLDQLKKLCTQVADDEDDEDYLEVEIKMGAMSSVKNVWYYEDTGRWDVFNFIDDTYQMHMSDEDLSELTNIVEAIDNGILYY